MLNEYCIAHVRHMLRKVMFTVRNNPPKKNPFQRFLKDDLWPHENEWMAAAKTAIIIRSAQMYNTIFKSIMIETFLSELAPNSSFSPLSQSSRTKVSLNL